MRPYRRLTPLFSGNNRSASTSSVARSSPRARARGLTPRLLASSAWSLPSACSTSVTASRSSAASPRRSRMRPYVYSFPTRTHESMLIIPLERVCPDSRQARFRGQGPQGRCPQAPGQLYAQVKLGRSVMGLGLLSETVTACLLGDSSGACIWNKHLHGISRE